MHINILSKEQQELLLFIAQFKRSFYLVGGTAIALYLGHRRSIDFDLFTYSRLNKIRIKQKLLQVPYKQNIIFEDYDQIHFNVNEVKLTFFNYPYAIEHPVRLDNVISMPSLLSLAAMNAFALGRRAKWKDYVDLYFMLKDFFSIEEISTEANKIFESHFSEKLFREQLAFHKDINYTEEVEYLIPNPPSVQEIQEGLITKATDIL
jgi:hypothetical protein